MQTRLAFRVTVLFTLMLSINDATAKQCDRQCLHALAESYLNAIVKHNAKILPLANNIKYTENGKTLTPGDGLWKDTTKVTNYRELFVDSQSGSALIVAVIESANAPAIIATRLRAPAGEITEVETIVARKGSHPLFSPDLMTTPDPMFSQELMKSQRSTRERMIAIANGYFDGLEKNSSKDIAATLECDRFENGSKTTHRTPTSGGCAQSADALSYIKGVKDRRFFIVDETTGVVASNILFDIPGGDPMTVPVTAGSDAKPGTMPRPARMLLLTELFKIQDGKIQRIQAIMQNLPHGAVSGWEK